MIYTLKIIAIAIPYFIGMFLTMKIVFPITYKLIEKGESAAKTFARQSRHDDFDMFFSVIFIFLCLVGWWIVAVVGIAIYIFTYIFRGIAIALPWTLGIILNSMKKCLVILPKIEIRKVK